MPNESDKPNNIQMNETDKKSDDETESQQIDDPIQKAMGNFGRWHAFIISVICLLKFPVAWQQMSIIFIGAPPTSFKCINETIEKCSEDCPGYDYDRSIFTETIITEWNLVCGNDQWANVSQLVFMLGILVGNFTFGTLADKFGRRVPLVIAVLIQIVSGIGTAFAPWFWLYCLLRFFTAVATGGTMSISFVLIMEIIGIRWRELISVLFHIPFNLGHLSLPLIAYFVRDWHKLQLALSIPSLILISYYWLIPESPRWLYTVGRLDESVVVLETAAKHNRLPTENIHSELIKFQRKQKENQTEQHATKGNIYDLLKTPNMRTKTLIMWFSWCVCGLTFFGVSQYVGHIGGDIFANVALSAILQVPGTLICIYTMRQFGRKKTIAFANLFTGIAMLIIVFIPIDATEIKLICASCGIIGMNLSFPAVYLYAGEIFPTVVRNIGVGSSSMAARIGTMLAPFVVSLSSRSHVLPPIIFGIVAILGSGMIMLLPETTGTPLPETLEDGEKFGNKLLKKQKAES